MALGITPSAGAGLLRQVQPVALAEVAHCIERGVIQLGETAADIGVSPFARTVKAIIELGASRRCSGVTIPFGQPLAEAAVQHRDRVVVDREQIAIEVRVGGKPDAAAGLVMLKPDARIDLQRVVDLPLVGDEAGDVGAIEAVGEIVGGKNR